MDIFQRLNGILSSVLAAVAGISLTLMMLLGSANIVFRYFDMPIKGSYELMGFLGALVAGCGLAYTQRYKGHIALTILSGWFPPRTERLLDACTYLLSSGFFMLIAWRSIAWAGRLKASGELSGDLNIAYYPIVIAMAFGIFALGLMLLNDLLKTLFQKQDKESRS